jgi:WD40-like Beta Propeller Repeat
MAVNRISPLVLTLALLTAWPAARADDENDSLAPWRGGVRVRPVSTESGRHTIHSYFNTTPESPDGRWVLFFSSTAADGQSGEVRILERATGREKVLARNVTAEDAHRVACQQWISHGRRVVFHDERNGEWMVVAVDVDSTQERILARGRQLGFGRPDSDLAPIYGMHWNPGAHRDLELVNVETGGIRTAVTADAVKAAYPEWIARQFGDRPISIFFPILSPDLKRVFFKLATPAGGDARSKQASERQGLCCYDLERNRFLFLRGKWGHPGWLPDSRTISEIPNRLIDSDTGAERRIPELPAFHGDHPSVSPDGRLFTTDTSLEKLGGKAGAWGVVVGNIRGREYIIIHRFDNSHGANSWRRSHPHPAFSPDGKRIYFNVSSGPWTQLHVAEAAELKPLKP